MVKSEKIWLGNVQKINLPPARQFLVFINISLIFKVFSNFLINIMYVIPQKVLFDQCQRTPPIIPNMFRRTSLFPAKTKTES